MGDHAVTLGSFFTNFARTVGLPGGSYMSLAGLAAHLWLAFIILAYVLSFGGLAFIVWLLMRIFDLRAREEEYYTTLIAGPEGAAAPSSRFARIRELAGSQSPSEWREAIIEADIMLDEALGAKGYAGMGVGEKLMQADRGSFAGLNDAWEAHKVRNAIAHEGSAFDLSDVLTQRTIARYERALGELGAL